MRSGHTEITSISLSKEMKSLIKDYNISPTEAVRRGIAMMLCEKKVKPYYNSLNEERLNQEKKYYIYLKIQEIEETLSKLKGLVHE